MTQETIVAAFDTPAQARAAAQDVQAAGIPASDIIQHAAESARQSSLADSDATGRKEPGFWAKLFGMDDDYTHDALSARDHGVYDRTLAGGGSVLSIRIADVERDGDRILNIIENHNPIDLEERAASYGQAGTAAGVPVTGIGAGGADMGTADAGQRNIELAEEALVVGKRVVSGGTTRIRRYVVETPVSEDVSLRQETVSVERRPVSGAGAIGADAFTDKTIEVTEMNEQAVVGKTARVVEEVVIRKDATDRVETVRDTVRREDVEIEKVEGATPVSTPKV